MSVRFNDPSITRYPVPFVDAYLGIDGTSLASGAVLAAWPLNYTNAKAPRGAIAFDSSTASAFSPLGSAGNIGVSDDFTIYGSLNVPSSNPASVSSFLVIDPSSQSPSTGTSSLRIIVSTTGVLQISFRNPANIGGSARDIFLTPNLIANWGGKSISLAIVCSNVRTTAALYINGCAVAFTNVDTTFFSYGSTISGYLILGQGAGAIPAIAKHQGWTLYNLALAAAEVLEIMESGGAVPDRYKFGSENDAAAAITFVLGGGGASGILSGASATGFTFSDAATESSQIWRKFGGGQLPNTPPGRLIQVSFNATLTSGQAPGFSIRNGGANGNSTSPGATTVVAGANSFLLTTALLLDGNSYYPFLITSAPTSYAISGLLIKQLGAVCHFGCDDGFGFQLIDSSTNRNHAVISQTGVSHVLPKNGAWVRFTTSTAGNEFVMGAAALLPANCSITRGFARARTNTPTVFLGTASGGAQIVASVALSTAWKPLTIVQTSGTNIAAGAVVTTNTPLYGASTSNDVVEWMVEIVSLTV